MLIRSQDNCFCQVDRTALSSYRTGFDWPKKVSTHTFGPAQESESQLPSGKIDQNPAASFHPHHVSRLSSIPLRALSLTKIISNFQLFFSILPLMPENLPLTKICQNERQSQCQKR